MAQFVIFTQRASRRPMLVNVDLVRFVEGDHSAATLFFTEEDVASIEVAESFDEVGKRLGAAHG
jgi:hypothetical protein